MAIADGFRLFYLLKQNRVHSREASVCPASWWTKLSGEVKLW